MLWLGRWLRTLIAWLDLTLFTVAMMLLARLPLGLLARFYPALFHSWCRCFVRALGVELRLHQRNLQPLPAQYILIANHPSAFEDVGIPALFPVSSLAKEEVRNWWFVGRIAVAAGTLFVHRESKSSRQAALQDMIAALKTGKSIAVYPEGGCKGRRIWNKFLYGAFTASLETGVPIVPVFLQYEAQETFEWRPHEHLLSKIWSIMTAPNRHANYHVYDAVDPAGFTSREEYSAHVYALYRLWQQRYLE